MARHVATSSPLRSGCAEQLDVARWCAAQGWPVHPLAPRQKTPAANCERCRRARHQPAECPCIPAGRWCHGFHAATTSPARIDAWWSAHPRLGVGVSCGPANLVVLDVDAHSAQIPDRSRLLPGIAIGPQVTLSGLATGFDTLALLAALRHQASPAEDGETLRVRTPSGGLHVWYLNLNPETRYRSSTGSSPKIALAWQVDIRSDGGYIVAPATRTTAGTYTRVGKARRPAPLPDWLAGELARTGHTQDTQEHSLPTAAPSGPSRRRAAASAFRILSPLLEAVAACRPIPEGAGFTEKLNRAAFTAGGLIGGGHLVEADTRTLLMEIAHSARPHQGYRNVSVIDSALSAGKKRPFHPKGRS
ncbi:bifunctional DNA primase/polymerase [Streptomyces sp. NPDC048663]|uniref:bifunctional DNA primase/polymerase n=1 Tax=Streptomyces sp. NPDC048663 TaxID=3155638 RepID=UPI0034126013